MSVIKYSPGIAPLPPNKEQILKDTLASVGIESLTLSSTFRTPAQQAQAMYNNAQTLGIASQRKLYGPAGNKVLDTYQLKKSYNYGPADTIAAMAITILSIGPSNVSAHCTSDPQKLLAFDIPPAQIPPEKKSLFESAMKKAMSKFLIPGVTTGEPVYHAEIGSFLQLAEKAAPVTLLILGAIGIVIYKLLNK